MNKIIKQINQSKVKKQTSYLMVFNDPTVYKKIKNHAKRQDVSVRKYIESACIQRMVTDDI